MSASVSYSKFVSKEEEMVPAPFLQAA